MHREMLLTAVATLLSTTVICLADDHEDGPAHTLACLKCMGKRDTLSNDWFGLGRQLAEEGISGNLSLTQIYQMNLHGGLATHRHAGRYTGSYDLEVEFDLEKLLRLKGARICVGAEGSWSDGLDVSSIGSVFGVNADAGGNRSMDLTELYYQQSLLKDRLQFLIGKLSLTSGFECRGRPVAFDGSAYANDETSQFLNSALVNNPTIPFPEDGLGAILYLQAVKWWYVAAGVADAQADARETGFNTAFHDEDYFFSTFETGLTPQIPSKNGSLQGAYRVGFWYDPQPKDKHDGSGTKRDDLGFYLSFDQTVVKERADKEDTQGLGVFARYGFADSDINDIKTFWSVGAQYRGPIPTRDNDVLGFGLAQGRLVKAAGFTRSHETAMELYYNAAITPWLSISPSLQYVFNPGGDRGVSDAVALGFRLQMRF